MEIAQQIVAMQRANTQGALQAKFMKMQANAEASLANMIAQVVAAAPQPGQGARVDKLA